MSRPTKDTTREEMIAAIKSTAREQMRIKGTAGLSLRGIAREMNITAPAIYNYFPTLNDLITALITDAFLSIAEAMRNAASTADNGSAVSRIYAAALAYRAWAAANPIQFQLIYGNPIPDYTAPAEITGPLARLPFEGLMHDFKRAYDSGEMKLPDSYFHLPASVHSSIVTYLGVVNFDMPEPVVYAIMASWVHIHGLVMLELFQHTTPIISDAAAFYKHEVIGLLRLLNMSPPTD